MTVPLPLANILARPYIRLYLTQVANGLGKRGLRAKAVQDGVLQWLVKMNGQSKFGREHGLAGGVSNYKEFAKRLPVCDYETYRPYVDRMVQGEREALLGGAAKLLMFALTSGTSGLPKQIPVTDLFLRNYRRGWSMVISRLYADHPEVWYQQIFQMSSPPDDYLTASGVPCGSISGMTARMQNWLARSYYAIPQEVCYIADTPSRYYAAARIAAEKDVRLFLTASPATLIGIARMIQQRSEDLLRDIRDGTLSANCQVAGELRNKLSSRLKPNPKLAQELASRASDDGLLPRDLWRPGVIGCWLGGTMGLYLPELRELYRPGALRDIGLLASEGRMNIPLRDNTPEGMLDIDNNFYEFIPADEMEGWTGPALLAGELEVGRKYFILLTTASGFFRYNISDVVEVTGYIGQAPLISFLNKGTRISSVVGEKISEHNVVQALMEACKSLGQKSNGCGQTVLCPQWGDPPFYQLNIDAAVFEQLDTSGNKTQLATEFDRALAGLNIEYKSKRKTNRLGPVQLRLLAPGYLAECDREKMARSVTARSQFKHRYLHTELGADKDFPVFSEVEKPRSSS